MTHPDPEIVESRRAGLESALARSTAKLAAHDEYALQYQPAGASSDALMEDSSFAVLAASLLDAPRPAKFALSEFAEMDVAALHKGYGTKAFCVKEVVSALFDDIRRLNPELKAYSEVFEDEALTEAARLDAELASGARPVGLFGVPVGIKDIIDVAGYTTTLGTQMYANHGPALSDADVVRKLRESKAVIVGKNSTHELAFGATSDSPYHGPVLNPHDLARVSGGSSGGSACAVAAGLATVSIGTDTGGSIRIPSAICGVYGLKATRGVISTRGTWILGFSLDEVGPIARSLGDVARAFKCMRNTPGRPATVEAPGSNRPQEGRLRVGIPTSWLESKRIHEDVWAAFQQALEVLEGAGYEVVHLAAHSMPDLYEMVALNRVFIMAEGSAQFGHLLEREDLSLTEESITRLHIGNAISAPLYLNAQRLREKLARQLTQSMSDVDVLMMPTLPAFGPRLGASTVGLADGQREDYRAALVRFTAPISVSGHPAMSIPVRLSDKTLPIGLQLVANYHREDSLFMAASLLSRLV